MGNDLKSLLTVVATTALLLTPATTVRGASISADAPTVTEVTPDGACGDGTGSSNATFDSNNHRMVVTPGGRTLVLYDPHGSGVDLAWKDPGEGWNEKSVFDNGSDEVSNDRPASIALDGAGHAWVVWSGHVFTKIAPVKMRRLTDLDAVDGPALGPTLTVQAADSGNTGVDIAFHEGRGHIVWLQRTGSTAYSLKTVSFTDLDSPTPDLSDRRVLDSSSHKQTTATLVSTPSGMRAVARTDKLRLYRYETTSGWTLGSAKTSAPAKARPSVVAFGGDILAAFQSSFNPGSVKVARFSNNGDSVSTSLSTGDGYVQPAIAASGSDAWVVMIRVASGTSVVSRTFDGSSWGGDATLMTKASADDGVFTWPNARRDVDGTLRFVVGQRCTQATRLQRSAVISFEKNLDTTPLNTTITGGPEGLTNKDTPTFHFSANRAVSSFKCRIDQGGFEECSHPHTVGPLQDGSHTFHVKAIEVGGDDTDSRTFKVDTLAPETRITNNPPRRTKAHKARFSFRANEKKSTFTCKRDRRRFKPCSSPKVYRGLKRGRHTFKVRAVDRADNVDPTPAVWRWRVKRR
jgi:hypothetical protein